MRDNPEPVLFNPRYAVSHLRGPVTRVELQRALAIQDAAIQDAAIQAAAIQTAAMHAAAMATPP